MNRLPVLIVLVVALLSSVAQAAVSLFDFEQEAQIEQWRIRSADQDTLAQAREYATSGNWSALFTTPAWKEGMEQWPAIEVTPPVSDWRGYDRLVIDITNPGKEPHFLSMMVSDSKVPFRNGLSYRIMLPLQGFRRFEIPLSGLPQAVDRSDIWVIHIFSQRPGSDMSLYIDSLSLLKAGETAPEPKTGFVRQIAGLSLGGLETLDGVVEDCRKQLYAQSGSAEMRRAADVGIAALQSRVQALRTRAEAGDITLAELDQLQQEFARLPTRAQRLPSLFKWRRDFNRRVSKESPMIVGFATSMEKVLPRDMPVDVTVAKGVRVSIARNEKESFQVLVTPRSGALEGVQVSVGDLQSASGDVLQAQNVDCDVVGYVETKRRPPYKVSYVGWWPDPILDFLGPVDVAQGDVQSFWIRVRTPKGQAPGLYRGALVVSADGGQPLSLNLSVKVHSFTLPDHTPLPTAITFFERKDQMGGEDNWPQMKLEYADFLADYYIDYDSLYRGGSPDYEIIQHLHDQGRLVAFNLGNVFNAGTKADGFEQAIAQTVERIRPAYERAKQLGVLDHAYIYGFDERPKEQFPLLERSAQALKQAFPDALLMTTSYDHSYGLESVVKTMEAWCPLTPRFDIERVAEARAGGKSVWWYICCGPHSPYANWFVEYAAIEARLLMGAMTAKYRPDGFLYYSLSIWNDNKPIEEGPFTQWNPVSWTTYHGDGSLLCSGPGASPCRRFALRTTVMAWKTSPTRAYSRGSSTGLRQRALGLPARRDAGWRRPTRRCPCLTGWSRRWASTPAIRRPCTPIAAGLRASSTLRTWRTQTRGAPTSACGASRLDSRRRLCWCAKSGTLSACHRFPEPAGAMVGGPGARTREPLERILTYGIPGA